MMDKQSRDVILGDSLPRDISGDSLPRDISGSYV